VDEMENMKMSDVWPSGFDGVDFSYGFYESAETLGGEKFKAKENEPLCGLIFSNEEPAKATMHAINNHDRLVEENAELREALKENEGLITYLMEKLSVKEFEKVEDKVVEVSLKNLKLLNK
jgi:hypothetical protein